MASFSLRIARYWKEWTDPRVDPNVAPLPPHISVEQAKNFLASILKGDAQALGFVKQIAKDVAAGYLPAKK